MKILFAAPHLYLPQLYGGVQTSIDQLCRALIEKGHQIAVLVRIKHGGMLAVKSLIKMKINAKIRKYSVARDTALGYPVWRTWFPEDVIEYVVSKESPDLIVIATGKIVPLALAAKRTKLPILLQLNDVAFHAHGGEFKDIGIMPAVANSRFTAEKHRRAYGLNPSVIHPFTCAEKYKIKTSRQNITFINPHPEKGRDIALAIARRCPDIPFSFVESWLLSPEQRSELMRRLSILSNVTLFASEKDMRNVYRKCKILLAPSIVEEAYGRVVTEAQINGIPVIASMRGGLPEAVGPGGILIDPDGPIDDWIKAVRKLWGDDAHYTALSAAALAHAQRPEITLAYQIDAWERALMTAANHR
jgi:glycosyltransferase involved in cell wall biosynthesis